MYTYIEGLYGEEWRAKCEFPAIEGSALVCCSTGKGSFACALVLLLVKDKVDFSVMKMCGETFALFVVSHSNNGGLTATKHLQIEASQFIQNVEYLCSYLNQDVSLTPLAKLADMYNQPLQFVKDYLESLIMSKPLSRLVLSTLLKSGKYSPLLAGLFRFYINKTNRYGYVGIYLDEKIDNIGYLSGRILATMEYIASLSENREPLRLDYSRFSVSPMSMFTKLSMTAKKYIYTVPQLGRQMYLKSLLDLLLEKAKGYSSTKRYLSDNDQAMFAIGYKHQTEYFADDVFTSKFNISNAIRQPNIVS